MTIITRAIKGGELTHGEMDTNFTDLRDGLNMMIPKTQNSGIKVDSLGSPTYSWDDINGVIHIDHLDNDNAVYVPFIGGIKALQFQQNSDVYIDFHIPHDYVIGSNMFIHVHWLHNATNVTGGSVTWVLETTYSKGHNQGAFHTPVFISVVQAASTIQNQHMVAETALSVPGGSSVQLDTNLLEVDGIIMCRIYLDSNDITISGGAQPHPFVLFVDIHYQSTAIGTKQKSPPFWT